LDKHDAVLKKKTKGTEEENPIHKRRKPNTQKKKKRNTADKISRGKEETNAKPRAVRKAGSRRYNHLTGFLGCINH